MGACRKEGFGSICVYLFSLLVWVVLVSFFTLRPLSSKVFLAISLLDFPFFMASWVSVNHLVHYSSCPFISRSFYFVFDIECTKTDLRWAHVESS